MKVLFVDDEVAILAALRRALSFATNDVEIFCAEGGQAALHQLATAGPVDVLVTDMRMPEMDGATLLQEVARHYPDTVRIVLSGYAEEEQTLRAAAVAHQYLAKPCSTKVLLEVLERAKRLRQTLSHPTLQRVLGGVGSLPSMPRLFAELTHVLNDPEVSLERVAAVVEQDPAMSAKLLQLVNSAFFASATRVGSVKEAVRRLGFATLRSIALSVELFGRPQGTSANQRDIEALQRHGLRVGRLAALLHPGNAAADAFSAGLLHDLGRLILLSNLPEVETQIVARMQSTHEAISQAETHVLGADHAHIGSYVLSLWGLPERIVHATETHHQPLHMEALRTMDLACAVRLADALLNDETPLDLAFFEQHGLNDQLQAWQELAQGV